MKKTVLFFGLLCAAMVSGATIDLHKAPVILRGSSFKATHKHVNTLTENYYNAINDGDAGTGWEPMETKGPHFIEMLWNQQVKISGIEWDGVGIGDATLCKWQKGQWLPVTKISGNSGKKAFPLDESDRWRLQIDRTTEKPMLFEVHLTGPEQYLLPREIPHGSDKGKISFSDVQLPKNVLHPGDALELSFKVSASPDTVPYGLMIELSDRAALKVLRDAGSDFVSGRYAAKPDADGKVSLKIELPPWIPHGTTDLLVTALADKSGKRINLENPILGTITVARPDFPPMLPPVKSVAIGTNEAGQRGFVINGKWHPAFFNRYYGHPTPERLAATAKTGLQILYWQNRDGMPLDEKAMQARLEWFDQRIKMALKVNPQNYFILSQVLKVYDRWLKKYPAEKMLLDDGTPNPDNLVSFGSELYLKQSEEFVRRWVQFISKQPYADRVIGYHVWTCTQNDCFIGGTKGNHAKKESRDFLLGDYHPGAQKLFREFLRKKYSNDLTALRKAWHDDKVTFETAFVPRADLVKADYPNSTFRDPVRSRPAIDYFEFFPTMIARYNARLAAVIKKESNRKALTMVHSGAIKGYLCGAWARQLQANNNDLADQLANPDIDVFVQAQPYDTREAGNAVHSYLPVKSLDLHNKLYLFDHDHRTLGAGVLKYGRHRSQYESAAVFARDYAYQWLDNAGAWISDMSLSRWWNFIEYRLPWFTMPEVVNPIHDTLGALQTLQTPRRNATEIAVVVSLHSPRYEDICHMVPQYKGLINDLLLRTGFPYLGAPHDVILSSDLDHPQLPEYKLYVFLNPTCFTPAERAAIDKLKRDGKVLAWFYAPGYSTDEGLSFDAMKKVCGFDLKIKKDAIETPELVFDGNSPLGAGLGGKKLTTVTWGGTENFSPTAISPIFYADDPAIQVAGRYADDKIAYGVKDFGSWKSVWCGVPNFDLPALVNLARFAGVHLYAKAPIVLNADNRMMMIHNGYEGKRTVEVTLPAPAKVSDLLTGKPVAEGKRFSVTLDAPETKLFKLEY